LAPSSLLFQNRPPAQLLPSLARWVADEFHDKVKKPVATASGALGQILTNAAPWVEDVTLGTVPQQQNGFDCGVFAIKFIERAAVGRRV
jgi:hypothetical protein